MGSLVNSGGTFASDSILGIVPITNPSNAGASDTTYATAVLLATQTTQYLKATNFNFAIPLDATVTGITVSVVRNSSVGSTTVDNSIRLVKAGVISGNDYASGTTWGTSDATATYGSDLWGLSFSPNDVNDPNFGVVISAITTLAATASIDYISITVDYIGSNRPGTMGELRVGDGESRSD